LSLNVLVLWLVSRVNGIRLMFSFSVWMRVRFRILKWMGTMGTGIHTVYTAYLKFRILF